MGILPQRVLIKSRVGLSTPTNKYMADQNAKSNQESGVASTTRASLNSTTESPQQERQCTNHDSSGESTSYHKDHSSSSSEQEEPQSKHPQHPRRSSVSPDPSVRVSRETSALRKRSRDSGLTSSGSNEAPCNICRHRRPSKIPRLARHHHHQGPGDSKRNSCCQSARLPSPDDFTVAATRKRRDSSDSSTELNLTSGNVTPQRKSRNAPDTFLASRSEGTVGPTCDRNPLEYNKRESDYPSTRLIASSQESGTRSNFNQDNLRPIILDGANVGHQWGRTRFSAVGYNIVYNHFREKLGYPDHKIVIVHKHIPSENLQEEDWAIIKDFKRKGILVHPPSRIVGDGETLIQSDDDVFCLNIAHVHHGVVLTADHYRRYWDLYPEYRDVLRFRLLKPTFVLGGLTLPDDPERTKTNGEEDLGQRLVGFLTREMGWDTPAQETADQYNETTNDHVTKLRMYGRTVFREKSYNQEAKEILSVENKMEISTKLHLTQHPNLPCASPYHIMERHRPCSHSGAPTSLIPRLTTDPGNRIGRLSQMTTGPTKRGYQPETQRPLLKNPREILVDLIDSLTSPQVGKYSLIVVDRTTGLTETIPLVNRETETCATALRDHWTSKFGIPDRITYNNERPFANDSWLDLLKLMGIKQIVTTRYNDKEIAVVKRLQRSLTGTM